MDQEKVGGEPGLEKSKGSVTWVPTKDSRIKKRNDQYWARFSRLGMRIEQCLFIKTTERGAFAKALEKTSEIEDLVRNKKDYREAFKTNEDKAELICELWPLFMKYGTEGSKIDKRKPWRAGTRKCYGWLEDKYIIPFWGNKLPSEIGKESWEKFIEWAHKESGKGPELLMFNHHKAFRTFCSYLLKIGKLEKKPIIWNPDPEPEDEDGAGSLYSDDEIATMIKTPELDLRLYVKMGALMGMRSSEITQLQKSRIDLETGGIKLLARDVKTGSKTGKGRFIPIPLMVIDDLIEQLHSTTSKYMFPNWRKDTGDRPMDKTGFKKPWRALKASVGREEYRFHDLRHTYATKVFSNPKINPVLACRALGMSMATAERIYLHFQEEHFKLLTENFDYSGYVK